MKTVEIYTDGSCLVNPGPGGWGAVLVYKGIEKEICGGEAQTTNNRMEITPAIEALSRLKEPCRVILTSDSQYLINAMSLGWADKWKAKNWRKGKSEESELIPNADLWQKLQQVAAPHDITWQWIRGHNGHPYNERCDRLANGFASTLQKQ